MSDIRFLALGAGQDVGRSCVIMTIGGRNIMFDCGMHMGYTDERRFPNFTHLGYPQKPLNECIDLVVITHFHLDHCGALPYLTEMRGYTGPILMTHPTKSLCPLLLEDFRKIVVERRVEVQQHQKDSFFTSLMIDQCIGRVRGLNEGEVFVSEDGEIEAVPLYAGHVLGAAMFYVKVKNRHGTGSVLYTGDYNMTPDRHLGAAATPLSLRPDCLITESTYATTLRESKRSRERDFLTNIHSCVARGGKVLIPVFAMGRVQELCLLVEGYWERQGLTVPIYFSAGMAESANQYYKRYSEWMNENVVDRLPERNMFDFRHVRTFDRSYIDHPGPMVLFSSPGMLHSGMSLEVFKKWASDEKNLLIIPGFCVSGTVGAKVLSGQRKFYFDESQGKEGVGAALEVKMEIKNMSFSAHADARGIMQMIKMVEPRSVILVHGEAAKMSILKSQIISEFGIDCYDPPNEKSITINTRTEVGNNNELPVMIDSKVMEDALRHLEEIAIELDEVKDEDQLMELVKVRSRGSFPVFGSLSAPPDPNKYSAILSTTTCDQQDCKGFFNMPIGITMEQIYTSLKEAVFPFLHPIKNDTHNITIRSITISTDEENRLSLQWNRHDSRIVLACIRALESLRKSISTNSNV